jgi:hypothetical protein
MGLLAVELLRKAKEEAHALFEDVEAADRLQHKLSKRGGSDA